jgi:hypothetical protein
VSELPPPSLRHLAVLTDEVGVFEHAWFDEPRRDLGYCTDDAGRLLAVACSLPADPDARRLATVALRFLSWAREDGASSFRLRLAGDGRWTGEPPSDDATGRALLGLGTAAALAPWPDVRDRARLLFERVAGFRSPYPRASAYAALGALAVLAVAPRCVPARKLVDATAVALPGPVTDPEWPWPEPRLTYGNAVLPEALLALAHLNGDERAQREALALLRWLVDAETRQTWFSFTPVGGRGPGDPRPAFDQQPIEAWAVADACARAFALTRDERWATDVARAAAWFTGDNDAGVAVFDPETAAGFDGLKRHGVNRNEGAESTLAFVGTMAQARATRLPAQAASSSRRAAASASRR